MRFTSVLKYGVLILCFTLTAFHLSIAAPFQQHYHGLYKQMVFGERTMQVIYYRNGDTTGFGNKLRAIYSAFLLSLATDKLLVIDYPAFFDHFQTPDGLKMDAKDFPNLKNKKAEKDIQIGGRGVNGRDRAFLRTADLHFVYESCEKVLYAQGFGFDEELMNNPNVRLKLLSLLGLDPQLEYSQKEGVSVVMPWLLQNITEWFKKGIQTTAASFGLPIFQQHARDNAELICCRFRFMGGRNRYQPFARCFSNIMQQLLASGTPSSPSTSRKIFFTTDKPHLVTKFREQFQDTYGTIVANPRQEERETNQAGNDYSPSSKHNHMPHPAMVDWYLLGECDYLIGSRSTFSLFATARTGNRPAQRVFTTPPLFPCREMPASNYTFK